MLANRFLLKEKVVIITGGAGLLGEKHAEAVLEAEGIPILLDISNDRLKKAERILHSKYPEQTVQTYCVDITARHELEGIKDKIISQYGHIDMLINNAANNPKVEGTSVNMKNACFEKFPLELWMDDMKVGLTGAFLCAQIFGSEIAKIHCGVILNISSDLGIIAPDQRIYRKDGLAKCDQNVKPVTYSVIKHGIIGLTKYLASYWADCGVRVNALCPAGVYNGQDEEFLQKLTNLIPMGRMADAEEYKGTIIYMLSEASSYMTGSVVVVDGGRTCW